MSATARSLVGLKSFIDMLAARGLPAALRAPEPSAPRAGESVMGAPFDPVLAAVHAYCDGGRLGDLVLFGRSLPSGGLEQFNLTLREDDDPRARKLLAFAKVKSMAYFLATVPSLADAEDVQPVVFLDNYEQKVVKPIASNVDRALGLYGTYVDKHLAIRRVLPGEDRDSPFESMSPRQFVEWLDNNKAEIDRLAAEGRLLQPSTPSFPFDFVDDIAQDQKLVRMLAEGRFDEVTRVERVSREWVEKLLARARALGTI